MGEYAEMMLDGTCCSFCGEFIGTDNGYSTPCASCADDDYQTPPKAPNRRMGKATRRALLEMHKSTKQTYVADNCADQIWSLVSRGFATRCRRWNYYELTDAGHAEAERIINNSN